jgi:hypothetical protein
MKILRGLLFGGIAYFLLGWLVWGILLMDFMTANSNQCAARPAGEMIWWALILSNLVAALFITLFLKWANARSVVKGLIIGALFGLLYASMVDLSMWSMTKMFNNIGILIADIFSSAVVFAIVGMIIVLTWGKEK